MASENSVRRQETLWNDNAAGEPDQSEEWRVSKWKSDSCPSNECWRNPVNVAGSAFTKSQNTTATQPMCLYK